MRVRYISEVWELERLQTAKLTFKVTQGYYGRPMEYFCPVVSFFFLLFSSPNLSGRRLDVYHTSIHGVVLVRI